MSDQLDAVTLEVLWTRIISVVREAAKACEPKSDMPATGRGARSTALMRRYGIRTLPVRRSTRIPSEARR